MVICKYRARVAALEEELHRLEAGRPPTSSGGATSSFQPMPISPSGAPSCTPARWPSTLKTRSHRVFCRLVHVYPAMYAIEALY